MSVLFSEVKLGSLTLANRLIRTASHEGLADGRGRPTAEQFAITATHVWLLPIRSRSVVTARRPDGALIL